MVAWTSCKKEGYMYESGRRNWADPIALLRKVVISDVIWYLEFVVEWCIKKKEVKAYSFLSLEIAYMKFT
jgi:hypothetical protein